MRRAASLLALAACLGLAGCQSSSIGGAAGAVVGTVSGAATANPVAGYAIGVTVQAALDATVKYVLREWKNDQQNVMANAAGALPIGQVRQWEIRQPLSIGNERGGIQVVRDIATPLTHCREVLFTVEQKDAPAPAYSSMICQQPGGQWKWAAAEPAVARWNGLQ
ncbi:hypothetical protein LMG26854_00222 [Achromobacter aegrifaciens]|uniref:hypothetical protein n=1 Tax=Achromobacter aegrifaciens TaxID=1287736 RepID=UPI0014655107|nr:hypothetical protein [Achromobacter aegrifaciens]CAB3811929.1 hypothetical protein LMG26854_00222 [Achromobacter aegrifaciens]